MTFYIDLLLKFFFVKYQKTTIKNIILENRDLYLLISNIKEADNYNLKRMWLALNFGDARISDKDEL
jgi:hypothetical protein